MALTSNPSLSDAERQAVRRAEHVLDVFVAYRPGEHELVNVEGYRTAIRDLMTDLLVTASALNPEQFDHQDDRDPVDRATRLSAHALADFIAERAGADSPHSIVSVDELVGRLEHALRARLVA